MPTPAQPSPSLPYTTHNLISAFRRRILSNRFLAIVGLAFLFILLIMVTPKKVFAASCSLPNGRGFIHGQPFRIRVNDLPRDWIRTLEFYFEVYSRYGTEWRKVDDNFNSPFKVPPGGIQIWEFDLSSAVTQGLVNENKVVIFRKRLPFDFPWAPNYLCETQIFIPATPTNPISQPTPLPSLINIPPTLTPKPISTSKTIRCSTGVVETSIPHPFPQNTSQVSLTFNNLSEGDYRLMVMLLDPFSPGTDPFRWIPVPPETQSTTGFPIHWTIHKSFQGENNIFNVKTDFVLQKKQGDVFPPDNCNLLGQCRPFENTVGYKGCSWYPQENVTCNFDVQPIAIQNADQVRFQVGVSGLPKEGFTGYRITVNQDGNFVRTYGITKEDYAGPLDGLYDKGHNYDFELEGAFFTSWQKLYPSFCPNGKKTIDLRSNNDTKSSLPALPTAHAYQICRPLCERITKPSERNACKSNVFWIESIPGGQDFLNKINGVIRESGKHLKEFTKDTPLFGDGGVFDWAENLDLKDPLREIFFKNVDDYVANNKDKGYEIFTCISCFSKGGAYTAIGCLPTNLPGLIKRFFELLNPIVFALLLIGFIYAGFMNIISGGDPKKLEENKSLIAALLAGAFLYFFSLFILGFFGVTILALPDFGFRP